MSTAPTERACYASGVFGLFGLSVPELLVLAFFGWLAWPLVKRVKRKSDARAR